MFHGRDYFGQILRGFTTAWIQLEDVRHHCRLYAPDPPNLKPHTSRPIYFLQPNCLKQGCQQQQVSKINMGLFSVCPALPQLHRGGQLLCTTSVVSCVYTVHRIPLPIGPLMLKTRQITHFLKVGSSKGLAFWTSVKKRHQSFHLKILHIVFFVCRRFHGAALVK